LRRSAVLAITVTAFGPALLARLVLTWTPGIAVGRARAGGRSPLLALRATLLFLLLALALALALALSAPTVGFTALLALRATLLVLLLALALALAAATVGLTALLAVAALPRLLPLLLVGVGRSFVSAQLVLFISGAVAVAFVRHVTLSWSFQCERSPYVACSKASLRRRRRSP
jgi:hypothetical protein